jgi:hypothetical protein
MNEFFKPILQLKKHYEDVLQDKPDFFTSCDLCKTAINILKRQNIKNTLTKKCTVCPWTEFENTTCTVFFHKLLASKMLEEETQVYKHIGEARQFDKKWAQIRLIQLNHWERTLLKE